MIMNNYNDQQELNQIDLLSIFSTILGVMNYIENQKQATNDDLMQELKLQDREYFQLLINQNNKIIELLNSIKEAKNES